MFSDARRTSGWTAPTSTLALRVTAELNTIGNSALAGISNDVPSTSQIPMAHREANLALDLSNVSQRVVQFSEVPIQSLLLHLAGEEFQRIKPGWHAKFLQVNNKQRGALIKTLRTYADANMNVLKTAELLSIHPNTIYARFDKIFDITGLDAKNFHSLNELLLVADCNKSN